MVEYNEYKSICNKCNRRTFFDKEQPCHITYPAIATCGTCGHKRKEYPIRMIPCGGTLKVIDYSLLDERFAEYYKSGQRIEVTYDSGETERFFVGKGIGNKPTWIKIKTSHSMRGEAIHCEVVTKITPLPTVRLGFEQ
jgi:hypothetical protein